MGANRKVVVRNREELVQLLAEWAAVEGQRITLYKFQRVSGVPQTQIYRYFDSWGDLRVAAGLPRRIKAQPWYTREDLLDALHTVAVMLGRIPTCKEFSDLSPINVQRLFRRFGSMKRAVEMYRDWLKRRKDIGGKPSDRLTNPQPPARDAEEDVRWMRREWFNLRVAFEVQSSDYRGRPEEACDLLVVLRHDWPACPVKVLEFAHVVPRAGVPIDQASGRA